LYSLAIFLIRDRYIIFTNMVTQNFKSQTFLIVSNIV